MNLMCKQAHIIKDRASSYPQLDFQFTAPIFHYYLALHND